MCIVCITKTQTYTLAQREREKEREREGTEREREGGEIAELRVFHKIHGSCVLNRHYPLTHISKTTWALLHTLNQFF